MGNEWRIKAQAVKLISAWENIMTAINEPVAPLLLRIRQVAALTGLSSPAIHHRYRAGSFPCPV